MRNLWEISTLEGCIWARRYTGLNPKQPSFQEVTSTHDYKWQVYLPMGTLLHQYKYVSLLVDLPVSPTWGVTWRKGNIFHCQLVRSLSSGFTVPGSFQSQLKESRFYNIVLPRKLKGPHCYWITTMLTVLRSCLKGSCMIIKFIK